MLIFAYNIYSRFQTGYIDKGRYVGDDSNTLTVSCTDNTNATFKVTRMDKTTNNEITASQDGSYAIPDFEGSLMFKIDGISNITGSSATDVTSVFLLVSVDKNSTRADALRSGVLRRQCYGRL